MRFGGGRSGGGGGAVAVPTENVLHETCATGLHDLRYLTVQAFTRLSAWFELESGFEFLSSMSHCEGDFTKIGVQRRRLNTSGLASNGTHLTPKLQFMTCNTNAKPIKTTE
ncbi:hypothetical protein BaRGS_00024608 [Batillaria attramentaria]|uniref:Uncharacterized protein n=1 Tax=Batillaria attramentaria TaxID=370345 RepID=A0ABD0KAH0_9CAEN